MSISNQQFTSRRTVYRPTYDDDAYKRLHWTKQLELRPLGSRQKREYEQGDYDNRLDNWDTPEEEETGNEPQ